MNVETRVELVVDDSEQQMLTPVLRHFLARGYNRRSVADAADRDGLDHDGLDCNSLDHDGLDRDSLESDGGVVASPPLTDPGLSDQIRLESSDGYVVVRSELLDREALLRIDLTGDEPVFSGSGVLLSITSSNHDRNDLRQAVGRAITEFGGLAARGEDPLDADHVFTDGRGVRRAILRRPAN